MVKVLSISIDPDDLNIINLYCLNNNINKSQFIVKTVIDKISKNKKVKK